MYVPLSAPNYGFEEIEAVVHCLHDRKVTMGENVAKFEEAFAKYIGVKYGVMVNSGSSANLIALSLLAPIGSEVITPAVTWATTVMPILDAQATPVLTDISIPDLIMEPTSVSYASSIKSKCLLPVHLLGNPCDMPILMNVAHSNLMLTMEDCCEAHGAEIDGKKVGSFGDISTFSFYFSHHISTIEGGMILTNDEDYANDARSLRAHGWIRDRTDKSKIVKDYPELDERFIFYRKGYCLRPTELEAAIGLVQLPKLEQFIRDREENAKYWNKQLESVEDVLTLPHPRRGVRHAWFCYPIGVKENAPFTRQDLEKHLRLKGIETRPIMSGNITKQPFLKGYKHRVPFPLTNSDIVSKDWFFIGNHSGIKEPEREYVAETILEYVKDAS